MVTATCALLNGKDIHLDSSLQLVCGDIISASLLIEPTWPHNGIPASHNCSFLVLFFASFSNI